MKIEISKIDVGRFSIREEFDEEYLEQLTQSLLDDGQWHPVIVRLKEGGGYELISGHYRLQASIKAGLAEIDATVRDVEDEEADLLSLKTNLLRKEMTPREQGRVLSRLMEKYGWSQSEVARKLSVEDKWVGRRLRVALDIHDEVANALDEGLINFSVASVVGGAPIEAQTDLLKIIMEKRVTAVNEAGAIRRQFLNDTIYTVGYEGLDIDGFIDLLKKNSIESVVDVRFSSESTGMPDFSGSILRRELERSKTKYEHRPEYGVPPMLETPYREGALSYQCLKQWYNWQVNTETDFNDFLKQIKKSGKVALMGEQKSAKPKKDQKFACHRDILADFVLKNRSKDPLLKFEKRVDL